MTEQTIPSDIQAVIDAFVAYRAVRDEMDAARLQAMETGAATYPDERSAEDALDDARRAAAATIDSMSDAEWAALVAHVLDTQGQVAALGLRRQRGIAC